MEYTEWIVRGCDPEAARTLMRAGMAPLTARVLASRGVSDREGLHAFLDASTLNDPFLFPEMQAACKRIKAAIATREKIAVYGDYDADGITAVCLLMKYLRHLGADCRYYIPDRLDEGYGLSRAALELLKEDGVSLIVTVDTGIAAVEETRFAAGLGIDIVITDHHRVGAALPEACAVINPHLPGYPFDGLAGVGVAFKLVCALGGPPEGLESEFYALAALGTVADVMPITGENRTIVSRGFRAIRRGASPGMGALIEKSGVSGRAVDSALTGFTLAPRINAAGRLGRAELALELLLSDRPDRVNALAARLCELNAERQRIENGIFEQAGARIEEQGGPGRLIVLADENWHPGVAGIVCARLAAIYGRPAMLICLEKGCGRGSARSLPGFNLYEALRECADLLEGFGGHELAAGFTIKSENVNALRDRLCGMEVCCRGGALEIDCAVTPGELDADAVEALQILEPHGAGNAQPVFLLPGVALSGISPIGGGKHVRFRVENVDAVFFGVEPGKLGVQEGQPADLAARVNLNCFRGTRRPQLIVCAVRPAQPDEP